MVSSEYEKLLQINEESRCLMGSPQNVIENSNVISPASSSVDKSELFQVTGLNSTISSQQRDMISTEMGGN